MSLPLSTSIQAPSKVGTCQADQPDLGENDAQSVDLIQAMTTTAFCVLPRKTVLAPDSQLEDPSLLPTDQNIMTP